MVLNMCLPHFQTSIHCNKLCADGYDVANLLSADQNVKRRGFKLEYFLRPPVHVTLSFQVRIEIYRLDLELWPWVMDSGSRRIEISTSSVKDDPNFQLVSRCDLRDELRVCLVHPTFKPREESQKPAHATEFWKSGSLGSVAQLRITIIYSGAAASVGFKSLSVWGLPSRSCSAAEIEAINRTVGSKLKPDPRIQGESASESKRAAKRRYEATFAHSSSDSEGLLMTKSPGVNLSVSTVDPNPDPDLNQIPEEFLDPLTQELMVLPMILPSGMIIDQSTLEEYEKREATWGRQPNDPFTGVPFTRNSKPLPNPLLKTRIDRLVLRMGCTGAGSRSNALNKPQPSRLVFADAKLRSEFEASRNHGSNSTSTSTNTPQTPCYGTVPHTELKSASQARSRASLSNKPVRSRVKDKEDESRVNPEQSRIQSKSVSGAKSRDERMDRSSSSESNSHERRLAESLNAALEAALNGLPAFTSQSEPQNTLQTKGGLSCVFCSRALSVFSSSSPSYSLPCEHVVCGECVRGRSPAAGAELHCPSCGSAVSSRDITRVHH